MSTDPEGVTGWCRALVFEAEDLGRAAAFWQGFLGVEMIDRRDDWIQSRTSRRPPAGWRSWAGGC